MATATKTQSNRANAQRSTGPTSAAGKARSSQNARTHGLSGGSTAVILPGQEQAYADLAASLRLELAPCGAVEEILFAALLHAAWTMHRCREAEADAYTHSTDPTLDPLLDPAMMSRLRLLDTYLRRAERAFHKSLKELRAMQAQAAVPAPAATRTNEPKPASTPVPPPAPHAPAWTAESLFARIYQDLPAPMPQSGGTQPRNGDPAAA